VPGGKQLFRSDIDEQPGSLWEDAEARLRVATIHAGIRQPIFGDWAPQQIPTGSWSSLTANCGRPRSAELSDHADAIRTRMR